MPNQQALKSRVYNFYKKNMKMENTLFGTISRWRATQKLQFIDI